MTVPANGEAQVTITVTLTDPKTTLAAFPTVHLWKDGRFWKRSMQMAAKLKMELHCTLPFLAFYGDWTEAPIIDAGFYYRQLDGETSQAQTYSNSAIVSSLEGYTIHTWATTNTPWAWGVSGGSECHSHRTMTILWIP